MQILWKRFQLILIFNLLILNWIKCLIRLIMKWVKVRMSLIILKILNRKNYRKKTSANSLQWLSHNLNQKLKINHRIKKLFNLKWRLINMNLKTMELKSIKLKITKLKSIKLKTMNLKSTTITSTINIINIISIINLIKVAKSTNIKSTWQENNKYKKSKNKH